MRKMVRRWSWLALVGFVAGGVLAPTVSAVTTVMEYVYNDDGALSAVTKRVAGGNPEVVYLTWDNFVPDPSRPSAGAVMPGTGSLRAIGATPGVEHASELFSFDPRDRLVDYRGPEGTETYDYHAKGEMASSSVGSDALLFFYDNGKNAKVTNILETASGTWSAYLDRVRFLDDGSEEVLLVPRKKDVACSYDPQAERLQSYPYEAYGASALVPPPQGTYDLNENPFRFAGEYRDPLWGGYYLRARWYHPDYTVFLSRDSMPNLNRYGYTAGNPVMRADPSGLKFDYMKEVGNPLGGFLRTLNKGVGGHFARIFLSPILGVLQIVANPGGFWHAVKTNQDGIDVFLALGVVSEVAGGYVDAAYAAAGTSFLRRFLTRAVSDAALGLGQSAVAAAGRGHGHFDWNTFAQGAELTGGAILYRGVFRLNVRKAKGLGAGAPRANVPQANVARVVDNLANAPAESSLSSQALVRDEPYEPPWMQRHDDGLLSNVDDAEFERQMIEHDVSSRQNDFLSTRRETRMELRQNAKLQLKGGHGRSFLREVKGSATRVSRAPSFDDILEESESSNPYSNKAADHSHGIIEELDG